MTARCLSLPRCIQSCPRKGRLHAANAYHRPDKHYIPRETFEDDGRIRTFMEGTDFYRMSPRSDLKYGSTRYVLASSAGTYVAHSNDGSRDMDLRGMSPGIYLLHWFDTTTGNAIEQVLMVAADDQTWPKPPDIGTEAALYVKRLDGVTLPKAR